MERFIRGLGMALLVGSAAACSKDGTDSGHMVSGTAHLVHGASVDAAASLLGPAARAVGPAAAPAAGYWGLSPNQGKATIVNISFTRADGTVSSFDLTNCTVSYARGGAALSSLADCPFQVEAGTYVSMSIGVSPTFQVLVDDATNGIWTTATGLTTTAPAGGAQMATYTANASASGGVLTLVDPLPSALVVADGSPPSVTLVLDMIHTLFATVSGSTITFDTSRPFPAVQIMPSTGSTGRAEYYTSSGTALNARMSGATDNDVYSVRVLYAGSQPTYLYSPILGPSSAWSANPANSPVTTSTGFRAGGYLGIDGTNTLCWAAPTDFTYGSYLKLRKLALVSAIGQKTSLISQNASSAPAPSSGNTYASGCPAITADESVSVTLVAH